MPNSLITRLPGASTSVKLLAGETFTATDRRTEMLRKISAQSRRLRGKIFPNAAYDATAKGRQDSLEALLKRGIIPILIGDGAVTLHANVQAFPSRRTGPDVVTVVSGAYSKTFSMVTPAASTVGPNADDATLAATGTVDFTATDSLDANATGMARANIT